MSGKERWNAVPGALLRTLAWLVPVAALMALSASVLYRQELANGIRVYQERSGRVVDVVAEVVERDLEAVTAEIRYLAGSSVLRDYLAGLPRARSRLEEELVDFSRHKGFYDQIRFLDSDGRERVRVNYRAGNPRATPESELQSKAARDYFTEGIELPRGEVYVSAFDLNVEHGRIERPLKPVVRFATPVHSGGDVRGVLVLNCLGEHLLRKVSETARTLPGEVALVNRQGFYLVHPHRRDLEWGFQVGEGRSYADDHPAAWAEIAGRADGLRIDDQGMFTFRSVAGEHAPAAGLLLIAHVPDESLRAGAAALLRKTVVTYGAVSPLLLGLLLLVAYAGSVRRRHERKIAESEVRLRALSAQLFTAQEEERRTISRDLHDDLGQLVTAVALKLDRAAGAPDRQAEKRAIAEAKHGIDTLISRVRDISTRLRPRMLDELGLKEAVHSFLSECEDRLGIAAEVELRFDRTDLPPEVAEHVYRILQEAVTNVAKHASVRTFVVRLAVDDRTVRLVVRDRGAGFDPRSIGGRGLGLLGMRERVELLGGTFRARSAPREGTEIDVEIPV